MNKRWTHILLFSLTVLIINGSLFAQDIEKKRTRIQLEYFQNHDKSVDLIAALKIREDRYVALSGSVVQFYSTRDTSIELMGKILTNDEGEAIFTITKDLEEFKDSLGFMNFAVEYAGDTSAQEAKDEITVKHANLVISFFQKDTTKFISVELNETAMENNMIPIEDQEVIFFVKGTFSLFQFADEQTDQDGKVDVEFPVDMPGDTTGILTIVAKIVENDTYGTIESRGDINWGKPVPLPAEKHRGLGDTDAPLWMVYTLIVLLSVVWFHYLYVVFHIYKIKKAKAAF